MNQLMNNPTYRDIVITNKTRLRMAYELLADVRNLSVTQEISQLVGQNDREIEAACTWLKRRLRAIECELGNPQCLECGCPMAAHDTVCSVCDWQKGSGN